MKKILLFAIAAVAFASCKNQDDDIVVIRKKTPVARENQSRIASDSLDWHEWCYEGAWGTPTTLFASVSAPELWLECQSHPAKPGYSIAIVNPDGQIVTLSVEGLKAKLDSIQ